MYSDRVNFDFEFSLFENNYVQTDKIKKLNEDLEYIYFFCSDEQSIFCPFKKYQKDYLDYLISLGLKLPKIDCSYPPRNWWGNTENLEIARLLNSKITSTKIASEHGLNPGGVAIIKTFDELSHHLSRSDIKNWICRNPYAMAGFNSLIFEKEDLESNRKFLSRQLEKSALILAPFFSRLLDLGFVFENGGIEVTWNLNSKSGRFKGGIVFEKIQSLSLLIEERFRKNFNEIMDTEKKMAEIFNQLGNKGIIQIDSFLYLENGLVKFYPLVEVNARKSMGYFINKLKIFLPENGVGLFISLNTSDLLSVQDFDQRKKSLGDILYSESRKIGVIPLSPIDGSFSSFFLSGETLEEVNNLKNVLWRRISHTGKILCPAFDFLPTK